MFSLKMMQALERSIANQAGPQRKEAADEAVHVRRQAPTESLVRRLEMVESLGAPSSGPAWSERAGSRGGSPSRSPTRNPGALSHSAGLPPGSFGDGNIPDRMPSADELTSVR